MNFIEAVRSVFSQYAGFSGRARRSEFWWFYLFAVLIQIPFYILEAALDVYPLITLVVGLALFLPYIAVAARRLHDTGRSGWWQLIGIIPLIGLIVLIVWYASDSQGDNKYGPNPKRLANGVGSSTI